MNGPPIETQGTVWDWCESAFGRDAVNNAKNRIRMMIEESIEAAQVLGTPEAELADQIGRIVRRTYDNPANQVPTTPDMIKKELGDIGVVWMMLCQFHGYHYQQCLDHAMSTNRAKGAEHYHRKFREKQALGIQEPDREAAE